MNKEKNKIKKDLLFEKAKKIYVECGSYKETAKRIGQPERTVSRWLSSEDINQKYRNKILLSEAKEAYLKYGSYAKVAKQVGKSPDLISSWLRAEGVDKEYRKSILYPKVKSLYEDKHNIKEVSQELGVSTDLISEWLHLDGVKVLRGGETSEEKIRLMRSLYEKFGSANFVGLKMGCRPHLVLKYCKDLVPPHRKKRSFSKETKNKVKKLREEGMSYSSIAKEVGAYRPSVWLWCNEQNK